MFKRFLAVAMLAVGGIAQGQVVSASFDVLDGADPGAPTPFGVIVIDCFVDVSNVPGSAWTAAGIRVVTRNGATLRYQLVDEDGDLNTPGLAPNLINTGSGNDRFVTSISRPRARNGAGRFDSAGAATAGDYDPAGPNPATASETELNVAFFASPPMSASDIGVDGYVARIAINAPAGANANTVVLGGPTPPAGFGILLAAIVGADDGAPAPGWVNVTYNAPTPTGGDSYLWWVPEPSSWMLLAVGALAIRRR